MATLARRLLPIVLDLVCVLVFAFGGKSSHEASDANTVVLKIVWPFAVAVIIGWAGAIWNGMRGLRVWPGGVTILAVTYVLGMALRLVSGRGIAVGFLIVALLFLALTMLGWRLIYAGWESWQVRRRLRL
jgi:hypothetical protein